MILYEQDIPGVLKEIRRKCASTKFPLLLEDGDTLTLNGQVYLFNQEDTQVGTIDYSLRMEFIDQEEDN